MQLPTRLTAIVSKANRHEQSLSPVERNEMHYQLYQPVSTTLDLSLL